MPLFDLKNAKRKLSSSAFRTRTLRLTQSSNDAEDEEAESSDGMTPVSILCTPDQLYKDQPREPQPIPEVVEVEEKLVTQLNEMKATDLDVMLSLESQTRIDNQQEILEVTVKSRPSRIKFKLPLTPPRSKSPEGRLHPIHRRNSIPDNSPTSLLSLRKTILWKWNQFALPGREDLNENALVVGIKVKLVNRPLPLMGTVKFIGNIHTEKGEWIGIELDDRVGNTDGMLDNIRYFQTDMQRGIFAKAEEVVVQS
ncbi:hypothetical protein BDB01DRAFT_836564 [Pilobolus umbonatus]|nr:hypothetical protein BDB01DRAFT_836564 [Pilobolus umbonatus]